MARSLLVEGPEGGSPFLWGKVLMSWFFFLDAFAFSWAAIFTYVHSSSLRLKRTLEQAQPSMAKRLKVGAASKNSGERFTPDIALAFCQLSWRLTFCL